MTKEAAYLDSAIGRYAPVVAATARAGVRKLRARFPGARVSVYDRRQSRAIGYAPDAGGGAIFSLVLYLRWVRFFFLTGVELGDPEGRLDGDGNQVRSICVEGAASVLDDRYIRTLITQALELSGADLKTGPGRVELRATLEPAASIASKASVKPDTNSVKPDTKTVARPGLKAPTRKTHARKAASTSKPVPRPVPEGDVFQGDVADAVTARRDRERRTLD